MTATDLQTPPSFARWTIWRKKALCEAVLNRRTPEQAPIMARIHEFSDLELTALLRAYKRHGLGGLKATQRFAV